MSDSVDYPTHSRRPRIPLHPLMGLTTRGRCLVAAGVTTIACAVVLDERNLLRIAVFVTALPLLVVVTSTLLRTRVHARRGLSTTHLPVGNSGAVQLDVRRTNSLARRDLLLEEQSPYAVGGRRRFAVDPFPKHRQTTVHYSIRPIQRGSHRIGPLHAIVSDPFGLFESGRQILPATQLVVTPRSTTLYGIPYRSCSATGESTQASLRNDPGPPDIIVRPYRHGDDLRKVHWRSTARKDEIMVRVDEQSHDTTRVTVLLDRRIGQETVPGLEWAVEFAASICTHLNRRQHRLRLLNEQGTLLAETPSNGSPNGALAALATVRPAATSHDQESRAVPRFGPGEKKLAILSVHNAASVRKLLSSWSRHHRNMAVLIDSSPQAHPALAADSGTGTPETVEKARALLRTSGWDVVVARPTDPIPQVWAHLCQVTAPDRVPNGRRSS